jgi:hypothetical protein
VRYGAKTDKNQARLVRNLRKAGCNVLSLAGVGQGCPDLLVHRAGQLYMLEVKRDDLPPSAGRNRRTPHQIRFHKDWPVHVVCTTAEALAAVGLTQEG